MNNLPKVVTQQRRGRASNPRLLDRKSDALPLSHRATCEGFDTDFHATGPRKTPLARALTTTFMPQVPGKPNLRGLQMGRKNGESADFRPINRYISEMIEDSH